MKNISNFAIIFAVILFLNINYSTQAQKSQKDNKSNNQNTSQNQSGQVVTPQGVQQNNQQNNQQANGVISVNFTSSDISFMYKAFNTVELKATEIEAFLLAQEKLKIIIDNPNFQKLTTDTPVKVDMELIAAEKMIMFANRITLTGAEIPRFRRFINAIYEAAKK